MNIIIMLILGGLIGAVVMLALGYLTYPRRSREEENGDD